MYRDDIPQLPPLIRLPRDEVVIRPCSDSHLAVGLYSRGGALYLQKVSLFDFPNDFIGIEDLERAGVLHVYVAAVQKLINGSAAVTGDVALAVPEVGDAR